MRGYFNVVLFMFQGGRGERGNVGRSGDPGLAGDPGAAGEKGETGEDGLPVTKQPPHTNT